MLNWAKDYPEVDPPERLSQGFLEIRDVAINETWRETQFQIIHKAYIPFMPSTQDKYSFNYSKCEGPASISNPKALVVPTH